MQQAKYYAEIMNLKFAYSTNGTRIVEYDFDTSTSVIFRLEIKKQLVRDINNKI
jgi:hypothetical protein